MLLDRKLLGVHSMNMTNMTSIHDKHVVAAKSYIEALRCADLEMIMEIFDNEAVVLSPVYGKVAASEFYKRLFEETRRSVLNIKNIFFSPDNPWCIALYFTYDWTLSDESSFNFDVVDIIDFNGTGKIEAIKIIYDASQTKPAVESLKPAMAPGHHEALHSRI